MRKNHRIYPEFITVHELRDAELYPRSGNGGG